ncbi:hypothetical protein R3P38DRAFT_3079460 [Favolaschia claudopus]|uniref:Glucose-methanol-choline oxidoreductase C-terminal domain-containing protein n=1 Tax=Favolaschia claudopus TaxID=2862362 RepID=A0AAV9ZVN1_9AGAR
MTQYYSGDHGGFQQCLYNIQRSILDQETYLLPTLLTLADHGFDGWMQTTLLPYLNLLHDLDVVDPQLLAIFTSFTLSPNVPILDLNSLAEDSSTDRCQRFDENLNITLNSLATKILLCESSDGSTTAYGVDFVRDAALPVAGNFEGKEDFGNRTQSVMAPSRSHCLCGGFSKAHNSSPAIGNSTQLSEFGIETVVDLPGVGSNLQDHDEIAIIWNLTENFKLLQGCKFLSDPAQDPCLEDWLQSDHMNIYGFTPVLDPVPDVFTYAAPAYFGGIFRGFAQQIADHPNALSAIVLKAHPSSRGLMHFEAEQGPADIQALEGTGINRIRSLQVPGKDANLTEYILDRPFLDNNFRVHGVEQLRVVDLSSWANVPGYFVTTPTYMISEKAADVIMADARAKTV